jgi:hypothetical protein
VLVLLPMASGNSASKARRMRAAAVKRNLYETAGGGGTSEDQLEMLVQAVSDIRSLLWWSVSGASWHDAWSPGVLAEPGLSQGHCKADGGVTTFPVFSGGVLCGSVPAEPGHCEADVFAENGLAEFIQRAEVGTCKADAVSNVGGECLENLWCSGCWEVLPNFCGCGSVRFCVHCVTGAAKVLAEPGDGKADVAASGGEQVGHDMVEALHEEMQKMTGNSQRAADVGGQVGSMLEHLRDLRDNMVTHDAVEALLHRI